MHVVLFEPEIPPNTGNIARLCAVTGSQLHLIEPLGFQLNNKQLQRAGMDYWRHVTWHRWPHWTTFIEACPSPLNLWLVESDGPRSYAEVRFGRDDYLVFGRESAGLPQTLLTQHRDRWLRIPMPNSNTRSLNLSNSVAIVLYEALRQQGFPSAS